MKKEKKFKLFDINRDGKGVFEVEDRKPTLAFFFKLLIRKFAQLFRLNLMMLFQAAPILLAVYLYFGGPQTQAATNMSFAPLYGIGKILPSASVTASLDLSGIQMNMAGFNPVGTIVIIALLVFLAVTYGWQNIGATYVLRGLFRGDAVFIWSDFFYAFKWNLKQGFLMGLIDFVLTLVLAIDFIFFYYQTGASFGLDFMYFMIFALIIIYLTMRFYIYHLLITFDLSILKILKNALIFTALGIKRNIMAMLGLIVLVGIHVFLIILLTPVGVSIPIILPMFYILAVGGFITTYAAYPVIDKYMIAPWSNENSASDDESEAIEEAIEE